MNEIEIDFTYILNNVISVLNTVHWWEKGTGNTHFKLGHLNDLHFMLSHHKLTGFDEYDYKDEYFNILSL